MNNGSEFQTVNDDSKYETKDTTLNAKLNNGSECQNEDAALNVELKEIWWV